jgi:hypothetical protein
LSRIEDLEDRVLDLALELGGQARIWRTADDKHPERVVRGLILDLAPGHESMSLLISPEGWLIGMLEIEDAEKGKLTEPPWIFVKTQFGSVEGHIAAVELLAALKREFIPGLEVSDEGGYWESRDVHELVRKRNALQAAMGALAEGLNKYGLSPEAAEDPEILIQRIVRVAELVHRTLGRASEHAPPTLPEGFNEFGEGLDPEEKEAAADEMYKHNRRRQERFQRYFEERLARGEDYEAAMDGALEDAGLVSAEGEVDEDDEFAEPGDREFELPDDPQFWNSAEDDEIDEESDEDSDDWKSSQPAVADKADDSDEGEANGENGEGKETHDEESDQPLPGEDRHPLVKRASKFYLQLHESFKDDTPGMRALLDTMFRGAGDLCGGLAQALPIEDDLVPAFGLAIVQLKRALRGIAFTRGSLYSVPPGTIPKPNYEQLLKTLDEIEDQAWQELSRAREAL